MKYKAQKYERHEGKTISSQYIYYTLMNVWKNDSSCKKNLV